MLEESDDIAIKKTSEDKLTYKNIIAEAIMDCRRTRGTTHFRYSVEGLESIIKFDVRGYKLLSELDKIKEELKKEKKLRVYYQKKKKGREYYRRSTNAKFKIDLMRWYWERYFEKIIQLLAENGLLMSIDRYISIKSVGENEKV